MTNKLLTPERLEEDVRFVLCEACGSEGRIYSESRPRWGEPTTIDHGPCGCCEGTGIACVEVEPVTLEDLDQ